MNIEIKQVDEQQAYMQYEYLPQDQFDETPRTDKNLNQEQLQNRMKDEQSPSQDTFRRIVIGKGKYRGWEFVRILGKVKIFMDKMKEIRLGQSFWMINQRHLEIIKDSTYTVFRDKNQFNGIYSIWNYILSFQELISELIQYIPVFKNDTLIMNCWKVVVLIQVIIQIIFLPIKFCFRINQEFTPESSRELTLDFIPVLVFLIDILVNFNSVFYEEGELVHDRLKIIKNYLSFQFWIDFLTTMILIIANGMEGTEYLYLVFILRIYQIGDLTSTIDEHWQLYSKLPTISTLINLIFIIFILANYGACGFYYVAITQNEQNPTWLSKNNLLQASQQIQYLYSLYFSFITMTTVGYGDIIPVSRNEIIYVIFMTLVSSGVFAYSVNTVGQIFQEKAQKNAKSKIHKYEINNYMRNRAISASLQIQVRKQLDYIQNKEDDNPDKGLDILNTLSKKLKEDVQKDFFGRIISEIKLFKFNFSQEFLEELALFTKEALYGRGEVIFSKGDLDEKLFFIFKGQVELYIEKPQLNKQEQKVVVVYDHKQKDENFGEVSLFTGQERSYSARTVQISHLLYIKRTDFISVIQEFPRDYERFCQIKDEIFFEYSKMNVRCYCCQIQGSQFKYGHSVIDCHFMHFVKNKSFQLQKINYTIDQIRSKQHRRKGNIINTLKMRNKIKKIVKKIRDKLQKIYLMYQSNVCDVNQLDNDDIYEEIDENDKEFFNRQIVKFRFVIESNDLVVDSEISEQEEDDEDEYASSDTLSDTSYTKQNDNSLNQYNDQNKKQFDKKSLNYIGMEIIDEDKEQELDNDNKSEFKIQTSLNQIDQDQIDDINQNSQRKSIVRKNFNIDLKLNLKKPQITINNESNFPDESPVLGQKNVGFFTNPVSNNHNVARQKKRKKTNNLLKVVHPLNVDSHLGFRKSLSSDQIHSRKSININLTQKNVDLLRLGIESQLFEQQPLQQNHHLHPPHVKKERQLSQLSQEKIQKTQPNNQQINLEQLFQQFQVNQNQVVALEKHQIKQQEIIHYNNNIFCILDFDFLKIYKNYFPLGNYPKILENLNLNISTNQKQKKQKNQKKLKLQKKIHQYIGFTHQQGNSKILRNSVINNNKKSENSQKLRSKFSRVHPFQLDPYINKTSHDSQKELNQQIFDQNSPVN